jgi:hypothetical protein
MSRWEDFLDDHPRAAELLSVRKYLPPLNFITIHYAYFIVVCLISSVIFWRSSEPAYSISYTDSLFLVVSAMTEAGLNTVNLSTLTTWQQTMLFLLIMLGSTIWVSIWTVLARKHFFERRFESIVRAERIRRLNRRGSTTSLSLPRLRRAISFGRAKTVPVPETSATLQATGTRAVKLEPSNSDEPDLDGRPPQVGEDDLFKLPRRVRASSLPDLGASVGQPPLPPPKTPPEPPVGKEGPPPRDPEPEPEQPNSSSPVGGHIVFVDTPHPQQGARDNLNATSTGVAPQADEARPRQRKGGRTPPDQDLSGDHSTVQHFLRSRAPGRKGQFHDLTSEEREHLGGCEYRALKILALVVPVYFFLWQLLGGLALGAWMSHNMPGTARANGINPWWLGIFNGVSAFNNSGMSLLDANMIPFQGAYFVLITMGLMILAGNTAYPLFLRLIIWTSLKLVRAVTAEDSCETLKTTLEFILKYPRRVYTNLFPSRPTWWLFFMLVWLNAVDWVAFELFNLGNSTITSIPTGSRILDGLFQALGRLLSPLSLLYA